MKRFEIAATILLTSIGIGLLAVVTFPISELGEENHSPTPPQEVHEHALFHVIINGTEYDFTSEEFQLESGRVHLENNKSDIVHKHEEGVTWQDFFNSIDINATRSNGTGNLCLKIKDEVTCGNGQAVLNGDQTIDFDKVISQGDKLVIVLNTENTEKVIEEYMQQSLPSAYKPESIRGRQV